MKKAICLFGLLFVLAFSFTGCNVGIEECATPFCKADTERFKDLCKHCREASETINNAIDGVKRFFGD